ncbi:MAG: helix-turn-helix transcriptional regulator [Armatimonadetes bacterium]|nr:helix-turn-helix transcriptional regulator [Armatimonadota bacterium]
MSETEKNRTKNRSARSGTIDPRYAELGAWIRQLRESKGLQQKPLSRAMGKPEHFLNRVESGRQRIGLVEFLELLNILDPERKVAIDRLLDFTIH